jgi:uncharacterized protein YneF (UPF0154 family)
MHTLTLIAVAFATLIVGIVVGLYITKEKP